MQCLSPISTRIFIIKFPLGKIRIITNQPQKCCAIVVIKLYSKLPKKRIITNNLQKCCAIVVPKFTRSLHRPGHPATYETQTWKQRCGEENMGSWPSEFRWPWWELIVTSEKIGFSNGFVCYVVEYDWLVLPIIRQHNFFHLHSNEPWLSMHMWAHPLI